MADQPPRFAGFFPGQPLIDAYGNGGFRFADMSHRGSILILPSGVHAWRPASAGEIKAADIRQITREAGDFDFLLAGLGPQLTPFPDAAERTLRKAGVRLELMDTGAAARTYNVLLAEKRRVAAALVAVE